MAKYRSNFATDMGTLISVYNRSNTLTGATTYEVMRDVKSIPHGRLCERLQELQKLDLISYDANLNRSKITEKGTEMIVSFAPLQELAKNLFSGLPQIQMRKEDLHKMEKTLKENMEIVKTKYETNPNNETVKYFYI